MVSFNNSIMIRNKNSMKGSERTIRETAKLIETLKKVGVIPKKTRRRRTIMTSLDESSAGAPLQGIAPTIPRVLNAAQQPDMNAQRLEEVQRGVTNALAMIRGQQQIEPIASDRFFGASPQGTPGIVDTNEFEGKVGGGQMRESTETAEDFDKPSGDIFLQEEPTTFGAPAEAPEPTQDDGAVDPGSLPAMTKKQDEKFQKKMQDAISKKQLSFRWEGKRVRTPLGQEEARKSEAQRRGVAKSALEAAPRLFAQNMELRAGQQQEPQFMTIPATQTFADY